MHKAGVGWPRRRPRGGAAIVGQSSVVSHDSCVCRRAAGQAGALAYAKRHFGPFQATRLREIMRLMGCLVYLRPVSPVSPAAAATGASNGGHEGGGGAAAMVIDEGEGQAQAGPGGEAQQAQGKVRAWSVRVRACACPHPLNTRPLARRPSRCGRACQCNGTSTLAQCVSYVQALHTLEGTPYAGLLSLVHWQKHGVTPLVFHVLPCRRCTRWRARRTRTCCRRARGTRRRRSSRGRRAA